MTTIGAQVVVMSAQDLFDLAYACLEEGDVAGAMQFREEIEKQMRSFGMGASLKKRYNRLSDAIQEASAQHVDVTSAARAVHASSPG